MLSPYKGNFRVTSVQGMRWGKMHQGLDMVGEDKMIYAIEGGTVVVSSIITDKNNAAWAFGNRVMIRGDDGKYIMYNHLSRRIVMQGQRVEEGTLIGVEGGTGNCVPAGASHLHIELRDRQGAPYKALPIAPYMGIPNAVMYHTKEEQEDMERVLQMIASKADFDQPAAAITAMKTLRHRFPKDFWDKIYRAMT